MCAGDRDVIMELGRTLMNTGITLGRGLAVIVDAMLKVSMLKPAQENSVPQQPRPRVSADEFSISLLIFFFLMLKS